MHGFGIDPVSLRAEMGRWYKMRLLIRQRPFHIQVYWNDTLVKEFGDAMLGGGILGGVGLRARGLALHASFDNFVIAWGIPLRNSS